MHGAWPLAASGCAAFACSVSSNVAAHHSKTVISRANPLALFYFREFGCQPSRALRRERRDGDVMNNQVLFPGIRLPTLRVCSGAKVRELR
jgi:hypothetical protein